ncbi:nucleotidyltransferase family protein [Marinicella rhabdoformis]|uniref:nucleotidyltransferase family protein n=1 Tax=Marinicella rhabdoformis TaxID=2580566 RepID=UPI001FEB90B9|nr:nucleotidyltransferase family protein [Marinicella rhabdoformis]
MSQRVKEWVVNDVMRMRVLTSVCQMDMPQAYVAAGFVRNMVWDHLHNKSVPTPLNDVDVIYFDPHEVEERRYLKCEHDLKILMPGVNWQVRNQALMHLRNGDRPYKDVVDAMCYWPEKETAIAIRLLNNGQLECVSAFGFDSLFDLKLTHNPKRSKGVFKNRIQSKGWLSKWSKLDVVMN